MPLSQTHGGLLPVDKVTAIKAAQARGEKAVMFVGDGINDGAALAQADVGVAMGSGMDVAIDTADVILTSSRLMNLGVLFDLAKRMDNNIGTESCHCDRNRCLIVKRLAHWVS